MRVTTSCRVRRRRSWRRAASMCSRLQAVLRLPSVSLRGLRAVVFVSTSDLHEANEHHRQSPPAGGRPREGHRPDAVRRRHRPAADAARQAAALAASARAHRPDRHGEGGGASGRAPRAHRRRRFRSRTASCRSATTSTRSVRTWSASSAIRSRPSSRATRPRPPTALALDRRRVRAAARRSRRRRTASPIPSRGFTTTATRATSTSSSRSQFGDVDEAIAGADHVFDDVFFFEGNTHLPLEQHAAVGAEGSGRQARRLLEHADAALPASRAGEGAGDAGGAHPRDRDAQRRRVRRQERSVQPRGRGRQGRDAARSAGEDHAVARGSLLLPSRPASRADAVSAPA